MTPIREKNGVSSSNGATRQVTQVSAGLVESSARRPKPRWYWIATWTPIEGKPAKSKKFPYDVMESNERLNLRFNSAGKSYSNCFRLDLPSFESVVLYRTHTL